MFEIDLINVDQVLLADGWHTVSNRSFTVGTCQVGQPKNAADKVCYWQDAAVWQEHPRGANELMCSITVPMHSIIAIRQRKLE